jgi:hypothetical protein
MNELIEARELAALARHLGPTTMGYAALPQRSGSCAIRR